MIDEDPDTTITAELAECAEAFWGWPLTAEAAAHAELFLILSVLCVLCGERDLQQFAHACRRVDLRTSKAGPLVVYLASSWPHKTDHGFESVPAWARMNANVQEGQRRFCDDDNEADSVGDGDISGSIRAEGLAESPKELRASEERISSVAVQLRVM